MNAQLKGRIFTSHGTTYLVLNRDDTSPEWLWVKAVNPSLSVKRMRTDEIQRCMPSLRAYAG